MTRVPLRRRITGLLLTIEAVVTEKPEPKGNAPAMPGGGGMDGMY